MDQHFTGFVFKLQANMDPKHRDKVAFLRICSGTFDRGMKARDDAPPGLSRLHRVSIPLSKRSEMFIRSAASTACPHAPALPLPR